MKKISYWARSHKWASRIIIVVSFIVLDVLAVLSGDLLRQLSVVIPFSWLLLFILLFLAAAMTYPAKNKKGVRINAAKFYTLQKSCDFILVASTFFMFMYGGNNPHKLFRFYPALHAALKNESSIPADSLGKKYRSVKEFAAMMKDAKGNELKWKEKRKLLKTQISEIKKSNELSSGEKTLLVIASILVALGLISLIAALACDLSCSGADAAAALVGIGGTALIVYLLVITIRSIYGKRKKQQKAAGNAMAGT
jgi:energy-coupling factor transporter transmembrane protein EcfT